MLSNIIIYGYLIPVIIISIWMGVNSEDVARQALALMKGPGAIKNADQTALMLAIVISVFCPVINLWTLFVVLRSIAIDVLFRISFYLLNKIVEDHLKILDMNEEDLQKQHKKRLKEFDQSL